MQLVRLLHNVFEKALPFVHKMRLESLFSAVEVACSTNKLYLTGLGREMMNANKTRSNIQKVNRLLGNTHLHKEFASFYKVMTGYLVKSKETPWIHVDLSCINAVTGLYVLRASLSLKGRSIVLYEECHPKKYENNHATHKQFLNNLKEIMPSSAKPVIVTDAGFRAPWFESVTKMGWDFVGRIRNKNAVLLESEIDWHLSSEFYNRATSKATYLGAGKLTIKRKQPCHFVLYKGQSKNRHKHNVNKQRSCSSKSIRHSRAQLDPWFLCSSLSESSYEPKEIVKIYHQRMRIEENFRDTKSPHYGLGLKKSLTMHPARMQILLLIGALATFSAWLAGLITKSAGKARDFQAHSSRHVSVLSTVFLGREALKRGLTFLKKIFYESLHKLHQLVIINKLEHLT